MKFKPIRFIPEYAGIHFMKAARYGFVGSAILIFFTIIIYFAIGINLGIDFRGGTLIEIRTAAPADLSVLREKLGALELGSGVELQEFGAPTDVLIRLPTQSDERRSKLPSRRCARHLAPGSTIAASRPSGPRSRRASRAAASSPSSSQSFW